MTAKTFPPDAVETEIGSPDVARSELAERDPSLFRYLSSRRRQFEQSFGAEYADLLDRTERAVHIALARFARRHGSWSDDFHAYHNESHALEILVDRIGYLCDRAGPESLPARDWLALVLFAAMHDLRQREIPDDDQRIGSNERASIDEAGRILALAGFDRVGDSDLFLDLEMMIAGSTFDTGSRRNLSSAQAASSAGALASQLVEEIRREHPDWPADPALSRRIRLTLIASDLDTANVAEPILKFASGSVRLCKEIETRLGRPELGRASAASVLRFLTDGQERYFFELHQFDSELGERVFGPMKDGNAQLLRELTGHLRDEFADRDPAQLTGAEIIEEFLHKAAELNGRAART